jgi:hypothetical protein
LDPKGAQTFKGWMNKKEVRDSMKVKERSMHHKRYDDEAMN